MPAKVGVKSCRFAGECVLFVSVYMDIINQLELCLHEQTQIVGNATCSVGSKQILSYIAS